jgi:hypothetical protein
MYCLSPLIFGFGGSSPSNLHPEIAVGSVIRESDTPVSGSLPRCGRGLTTDADDLALEVRDVNVPRLK